MAYSRFLLLLIGALSSHFPEAEAGAVNFWCNPEIRGKRKENADVMIDRTINCQSTSDARTAPLRCPYVGINSQRWNNLTVLEKFADVVRDLQALHDGLEEATNQTAVICQGFLNDIKHHIRNNRVILQRQIQNATAEISSPLQTCSGLTEVLGRYQKLLQGKLELFVNSYSDSICNKDTMDFSGKG